MNGHLPVGKHDAELHLTAQGPDEIRNGFDLWVGPALQARNRGLFDLQTFRDLVLRYAIEFADAPKPAGSVFMGGDEELQDPVRGPFRGAEDFFGPFAKGSLSTVGKTKSESRSPFDGEFPSTGEIDPPIAQLVTTAFQAGFQGRAFLGQKAEKPREFSGR